MSWALHKTSNNLPAFACFVGQSEPAARLIKMARLGTMCAAESVD